VTFFNGRNASFGPYSTHLGVGSTSHGDGISSDKAAPPPANEKIETSIIRPTHFLPPMKYPRTRLCLLIDASSLPRNGIDNSTPGHTQIEERAASCWEREAAILAPEIWKETTGSVFIEDSGFCPDPGIVGGARVRLRDSTRRSDIHPIGGSAVVDVSFGYAALGR
jgi:hypothetical protein